MKLQMTYDSMSAVPKEFAGAYTEKDGKAVLTGGDFDFRTASDVEAMKTAKDHANSELSEMKAKLKSFDGLDPDEYKKVLDEVDLLRTKVKDGSDEDTIKDLVELKVNRMTENLVKEKSSLTEELEKLKDFKAKTEKETVLSKALEGVSKDAIEDARFIVGSLVERQADGSFLSNGTNGFEKGLPIEQVVAKAMESRPYWQKQNTPGHGSNGASGGGGFKTKMAEWSELTEKSKKGELDMASKQKMVALAQEIKAEQQGE